MTEIETEVGSEAIRAVRVALRGLRFGSVEIVVHDGCVVQVERREKVRIERADACRPGHRRLTSARTALADRPSGGRGSEESR
jgi:hypothetical protein